MVPTYRFYFKFQSANRLRYAITDLVPQQPFFGSLRACPRVHCLLPGLNETSAIPKMSFLWHSLVYCGKAPNRTVKVGIQCAVGSSPHRGTENLSSLKRMRGANLLSVGGRL